MEIDVGADLAALDQALAALPNSPAVFLLWLHQGEPFLGRTALLRRRLLRLLRERAAPSRFLNLRHTVRRIEYWATGSRLESSLKMYQLARAHFPETYLDLLKLRLPPYVKLILSNRFPRTVVTTHLTGGGARFFGPFRTRASAERFESQLLDLFAIRRCEPDLEPSPDHPGCIYGEMGMCLRPCQLVVGEDEYRHEVDRVAEFFSTAGATLIERVTASRDRLSRELLFEEAARQHKRLEKIQETLQLRDELARDIAHLSGVAVAPSPADAATSVELIFLHQGWWQAPRRFSFEVVEGKSVSLDAKIRELVAGVEWKAGGVRERQEHIALLARWYYSSWRDGEWLEFERPEDIPYRRLVRAISKTARQPHPA